MLMHTENLPVGPLFSVLVMGLAHTVENNLVECYHGFYNTCLGNTWSCCC